MAAVFCGTMAGCFNSGSGQHESLIHYQENLVRCSRLERSPKGLDMLGSISMAGGPKLKVSKDKSGKDIVDLSLENAVKVALANNLDIRVVAFDPEISRQELIQAAAVFDYVVFAGAGFDHSDLRLNSAAARHQRTNTNSYQVGLKNHTATGADVSLTYEMTRTWSSSNVTRWTSAYEPTVTLELTQPLLRGAWPGVNLATLRIARINRDISDLAFRSKVEQVAFEVESTYWLLVQARSEVDIQRKLLEETKKTQKRIVAREKFDVKRPQLMQIKAAVETRRAALIRARKVVLDVQDQLARMLLDDKINLLDDYEIAPKTKARIGKVKFDRNDQLLSALKKNSSMKQAELEIKAAGINVRVAKQELLPKLDLTASTGLQGMDNSAGEGHRQMSSTRYHSYGVGLVFEYPIGNRGAKAELEKRRFQRLKAVKSMRNLAVQIAQDIKENLRQLDATYQEMQAQQAAVEAAKAQLTALEAEEEVRGRLTPEFLQVKLNAQETLATAESGQLQAIVKYNTALSALSRLNGTVLDQYGVETIK